MPGGGRRAVERGLPIRGWRGSSAGRAARRAASSLPRGRSPDRLDRRDRLGRGGRPARFDAVRAEVAWPGRVSRPAQVVAPTSGRLREELDLRSRLREKRGARSRIARRHTQSGRRGRSAAQSTSGTSAGESSGGALRLAEARAARGEVAAERQGPDPRSSSRSRLGSTALRARSPASRGSQAPRRRVGRGHVVSLIGGGPAH